VCAWQWCSSRRFGSFIGSPSDMCVKDGKLICRCGAEVPEVFDGTTGQYLGRFLLGNYS
jgi:hypothetical protein